MVMYNNGGIYCVDLRGESSAEFTGKHPSIIIRHVHEQEMYYIIPLTTFTEDRWIKYKKQFGCRIKSTGSIALVSKMEVRCFRHIDGRYFSKYTTPSAPMTPTPEEIAAVLNKLQRYIEAGLRESEKSYRKYYAQQEGLVSRIALAATKGVGSDEFLSVFTAAEGDASGTVFLMKEEGLCNLLSNVDVRSIITRHIPCRVSYDSAARAYKVIFPKPLDITL